MIRQIAAVGVLVCSLPLPAAAAAPPTPAAPVAVTLAASGATALPGLAQVDSGTTQNGCQKGSSVTSSAIPWAQTFLRPDEVWSLTEGAGVTVAVVGSGVDDTSGALAGRLTIGARAWGRTTSAEDCVGHGTFVSGLIAAGRRVGVGFAGIAPEANVLAVGVTDQTGVTTAAVLAIGIRTAAEDGARVIDIAVPAQISSPALIGAVRFAQAAGALIVAPAALDGDQSAGQGAVYPAAYPEVLSVSGLGPGGAPSQQRSSGGGPVDLTAPGDSVMSIGPAGTGYFTASGPSFAAAFVAGAAALTLGYRPYLTAPQLLHRLEATANHPGTTMPDSQLGYGTIDPVAAVTAFVPGENGQRVPLPPAPPRRPMPRLAVVDTSAGRVPALMVSGTALSVVLGVVALGVVLPLGRRRGWSPGRYSGPAGEP